MKKSISFLLALIAVLSMNLSAFALEGSVEQIPTTENSIVENENQEVGSLSLGTAENSEISLSSIIAPNQTLRFPILISENGSFVPLTEKHMEGKRLRLDRVENDKAVRSVKIVEDNGAYFLEVQTLLGYPTEISGYSAHLNLLDKGSGEISHSMKFSFGVGYESISDEAVEAVANGAFIFIDNSAPVITAEQFERMDELTNGRKITITNGDWSIEVRVGGQKSVNLLHHQHAIKDIVSQFEDANFSFLSFPAGPAFDFTGTFTLDVTDELEQWDDLHLYSYYNGKLNKVHATLNEDDGTLSFKSKYSGQFVLADEDIKNGTVIEDCNNACDNVVNTPSNNKPNPSTGAGPFAKIATVMATLSASILSFLGFKKDKK